jgi:hypothetical protein
MLGKRYWGALDHFSVKGVKGADQSYRNGFLPHSCQLLGNDPPIPANSCQTANFVRIEN